MLFNVYKQKDSLPMGFGDFIRGCISCHQLSIEEGFKFEIDLGHASKYFKPLHTPTSDPSTRKVHCFHNEKRDFIKEKLWVVVGQKWKYLNNYHSYIFTNCWPKYAAQSSHNSDWGYIEQATKEFIKDRLQPSETLLKEYEPINETYEVIHIRAGDPLSFGAPPETKAFRQPSLKNIRNTVLGELIQIYEKTNKHILIISDSNAVKREFLKIKASFKLDRLIILDNKPEHSGVDISVNTLYDFLHLINSTKIHQMSVYEWGSGFSNVANHIYDVPMLKYDRINYNANIT